METGSWARPAGFRFFICQLFLTRQHYPADYDPGIADRFAGYLGLTDGEVFRDLPMICFTDPREIAQLAPRALAALHVHRGVSPPSGRAWSRFARALHMILLRCMALFARRLSLAPAPAFARSGFGA
ncbi:hypothetical protein [Kitasatospora sp. NPDC098663]|uniref:hypothetical protein n=1 Tax=Kitasatospora sp. NPDC098663 TaxID=3364096 RepID=UPI0037FB77D5